MDLLLTTLTSPLLGGSIGFGLALTLWGAVGAVVYAGLYYSVPRLLLKWMSRCAIHVEVQTG